MQFFSMGQLGNEKNEIWHKGSLEKMMPKCQIHAQHAHSTEKACDSTLDDETYHVRYRDRRRPIDKNMSDGTQHADVTVLCNQPVAFTLNLGDDQPRYLFIY